MTTDTDDFPGWIPATIAAGMAVLFAGKLTGVHAVTLAGMAVLLTGAVGYLAHGGKLIGWGKREQPCPGAARGLVGSRISTGEAIFTVLDDSAVRGAAGRRATVTAADEAGNVGLLFVGLDHHGRVTEARTAGGPWTAAAVIG